MKVNRGNFVKITTVFAFFFQKGCPQLADPQKLTVNYQ